MILVDASVWIGFFNGHDRPAVRALVSLLEEGAAPLAIADLVLFEVLRGFRQEADYLAAERALRAIDVVTIGGEATARRAAEHWRALRALGVTVASPIDTLQAAWCIDAGHALLHDDRDFDAFARHRGLRVWPTRPIPR